MDPEPESSIERPADSELVTLGIDRPTEARLAENPRPLAAANAQRLQAPAALFAPQRPPQFALLGDSGSPVMLTPNWVEDSAGATVCVDRSDAAAFAAYLRHSLRLIVDNQRIAAADRGWAAHRALLHEVAVLYGGPAARARASALIAVMGDLVSLILQHGNPDALFSSVRGDTPYSSVVHAMETAIGAISLATADGERGRNFLAMLGTGAVFADVGLLDVPVAIREKTTMLAPSEVEALRRHPELSTQRMRALGITAPVAQQAAASHHERWDGTGYPAGLVGEAIPVEARYVAVADAYSTLTVRHRGTPRLTRLEALDQIAGATGQFDPAVVHHLIELLAPGRAADCAQATRGATPSADEAAG